MYKERNNQRDNQYYSIKYSCWFILYYLDVSSFIVFSFLSGPFSNSNSVTLSNIPSSENEHTDIINSSNSISFDSSNYFVLFMNRIDQYVNWYFSSVLLVYSFLYVIIIVFFCFF